jgi:hypothetical protein
MKKIIILASLFMLILVCATCSVAEIKREKVLYNFLYSKDINKEEQSYWYILRNKETYSDEIFQELMKYQNRTDVPDKLIYLAAILKDERFIKPLVRLLEKPEYSERQCIYYCPIIFFLTIYECFTKYSLPQDLFIKKSSSAVWDLESNIKYVKSISLQKEKASKYIKGPGVDSLFKKYESLSTEQLIALAGPYNKDKNSRQVAADILSYSIDNDEHILQLYWLAIEEVRGASDEYRGAIYRAIYRAETAKKQKASEERGGRS